MDLELGLPLIQTVRTFRGKILILKQKLGNRSSRVFTDKRGAWIQVDMKVNTTLTGVVTQGRPDANQWVTRYKISSGSFPDELKFVQDDDGNDVVSIMTSLCK